MKLRLPHVLLMLVTCCCSMADAAIMHSDVSPITYTDFASNSGHYATGTTNAMLEYIRTRDGGVRIEYSDTAIGRENGYILPHGMLSFEAVSDIGSSTAIGYNYVVTVAHQESAPNPVFTSNDWGIGTANSIKYYGIEEGTKFVHQLFGGEKDYKVTRTWKLITDVTPASVYTGDVDSLCKNNELVYRVGGGTQQQWTTNGTVQDVYAGGKYTVGGIGYLSSTKDLSSGSDDFHLTYLTTADKTSSGGATDKTPLPFGTQGGDSGSPYFVWNGENFQFLMAHIGTNGDTYKRAGSAAEWTQSVMDADNFVIDMGKVKEGTLRIQGASIDEKDEGITDTLQGVPFTATAARGFLADGNGNLYAENGDTFYRAVATVTNETGTNETDTITWTWKSLSSLKDQDNWYAYGTSEQTNSNDLGKAFLNAQDSVVFQENPETGDKEGKVTEGLTYAELYLTQNLVFKAAKNDATYNLNVTENTDLGIGYLHLANPTGQDGKPLYKDVVFNLSSADKKLLNSAGYVVDKGVTLNVSLVNSESDYMREWRKVGEGDLRLCGEGNNEIFLNVGGSGRTLLEQEEGYAAYNVLVNTGSIVKIKDKSQIYRDLTFGNGGGTLDMNGVEMDWYTTSGEKRDGFTIRALTEEAVITNSNGEKTAVLSFRESGKQVFAGSFQDSDSSALKIVYDAVQEGGKENVWELNSIRTSLTNKDSGLLVNSGMVRLAGTLTVHGMGSSVSGVNGEVDFKLIEDDWHYADATMNVTVEKNATFELGSHARLSGNVMVQTGGTYLMREGVNHAEEYIEGGLTKERTDGEVARYYGHKGHVKLQNGATMKVAYTAGTDTATTYDGNVSGPGSLVIDLGTDKAAFNMSGQLTGLESITLKNKSQLNLRGVAEATTTTIDQGASLVIQDKEDGKDQVQISASGTSATLYQVQLSSTSTEAKMEATGAEARVESARVEVQTGTTLVLNNLTLADNVKLTGTGFVSLNHVTLSLTSSNTAAVETGVDASITLQGCGSADTLVLRDGSVVYSMISDSLEGSMTLTGNSLVLDMRELGDMSAYDALQFSFGNAAAAAAIELAEDSVPTFAALDTLKIQAMMADGSVLQGYYSEQAPGCIYFASVPEPASATLSLLGLAALCARRRRKSA